MTKLESIKQHWIDVIGEENYQSVLKNNEFKEDGWRRVKSIPIFSEDVYDILKYSTYLFSIRPKSLQGIENNREWIKIESTADFPKEDIDCHFIYLKSKGKYQTFGVFDRKLNSFWSGSINITNVTHYQPIQKPQPPIY